VAGFSLFMAFNRPVSRFGPVAQLLAKDRATLTVEDEAAAAR
jgi:hypothetical protein